jgi:hypothetical protein
MCFVFPVRKMTAPVEGGWVADLGHGWQEDGLKRAGKIWLGWLLTLTLSGCLVMGKNKQYQPFDTEKLSPVAIGTSTADQVCQFFGAPTETVELANGNAYVYRRSVSKGRG